MRKVENTMKKKYLFEKTCFLLVRNIFYGNERAQNMPDVTRRLVTNTIN